jgi:hypothetical protein
MTIEDVLKEVGGNYLGEPSSGFQDAEDGPIPEELRFQEKCPKAAASSAEEKVDPSDLLRTIEKTEKERDLYLEAQSLGTLKEIKASISKRKKDEQKAWEEKVKAQQTVSKIGHGNSGDGEGVGGKSGLDVRTGQGMTIRSRKHEPRPLIPSRSPYEATAFSGPWGSKNPVTVSRADQDKSVREASWGRRGPLPGQALKQEESIYERIMTFPRMTKETVKPLVQNRDPHLSEIPGLWKVPSSDSEAPLSEVSGYSEVHGHLEVPDFKEAPCLSETDNQSYLAALSAASLQSMNDSASDDEGDGFLMEDLRDYFRKECNPPSRFSLTHFPIPNVIPSEHSSGWPLSIEDSRLLREDQDPVFGISVYKTLRAIDLDKASPEYTTLFM